MKLEKLRASFLVAAGACALTCTGMPAAIAQNSWQFVAPMLQARNEFGATATPNGTIYAVGGGFAGQHLTAVERYDPAANMWSSVASTPEPRDACTAAAGLNGRVYVFGGASDGSVDCYDPVAGTWFKVAAMPGGSRSYLSATRGTDGRIYVAGGLDASGPLSRLEVYDTTQDAWSVLPPMPTARTETGAATAPDGRIFVIGGSIYLAGGGSAPVTTVETYNPSRGVWSTAAPLPIALGSCAAATGADGRIYAIGDGITNVQVYDPVTNTWSVGPPLNVGRYRTALVADSNGALYTLGGNNNGQYFNSVEMLVLRQPDASPPVTSAATSGTTGTGGWYRGAVTVTLTATDPDGAGDVARTYYTIDGAAQQTYSGPFSVSGDGTHTVSYWSVDKAGNEEKPHPSQGISIDATPPSVSFGSPSPGPNTYGWNNTAVDLPYTVSDSTSGVAGVTSGTLHFASEGAGQTQTVTVTDNAGNSAKVTSPVVNIDLTPPSISITAPAQGAVYLLNQSVTVSFTAQDALSGILSFGSTLANGTALPTSGPGSFSFAVSAQDKAGNSATATSSYSVGYAVQALYDQTRAVKQGACYPIKIQLNDANGVDVSSPGIVVHAASVTMASTSAPGALVDTGNANPDNDFRFDSTLGTSGGYIFNLSTAPLSTGTWNLSFTAGSDPTLHSVQFQVK